MKIIFKYIIKQLIEYTFIVQLFIISVYVFASTMQQTKYIGKYSATFTDILIFNLMKIPYSTYQTLPIAVTCATVLVMISLVKNNELLVYLSSGGRLVSLAVPFFVTGAILSILMFFLGDYVNPKILNARSKYKKEKIEKREFYNIGKIENIWLKEKKGKFVYIGFIDPINKIASNIKEYYIEDSFNPYKLVTIERAEKKNKEWIFYDYKEYDIRDIPILITHIDKKYDINNSLSELITIPDNNPKLLRMEDLSKIISFYDLRGINTDKYKLVFYSKISQPLSIIVLILLILPLSVNFSRHFSYLLIASNALGVVFLYWFIAASFLSLGKTGAFGPVTANFLPLLSFFIMALVLTFKREKGI